MAYNIKHGKTNHVIRPPQNDWYLNYYSYLYNFGFKKIADKYLLEDLIQSTFLIALEKLGDFEGRSSEKTWLIGILKNLIFETYRKQKYERLLLAGGIFDLTKMGNYKDDYDRPYKPVFEEKNEEVSQISLEVIMDAINRLPPLWTYLCHI